MIGMKMSHNDIGQAVWIKPGFAADRENGFAGPSISTIRSPPTNTMWVFSLTASGILVAVPSIINFSHSLFP